MPILTSPRGTYHVKYGFLDSAAIPQLRPKGSSRAEVVKVDGSISQAEAASQGSIRTGSHYLPVALDDVRGDLSSDRRSVIVRLGAMTTDGNGAWTFGLYNESEHDMAIVVERIDPTGSVRVAGSEKGFLVKRFHWLRVAAGGPSSGPSVGLMYQFGWYKVTEVIEDNRPQQNKWQLDVAGGLVARFAFDFS